MLNHADLEMSLGGHHAFNLLQGVILRQLVSLR